FFVLRTRTIWAPEVLPRPPPKGPGQTPPPPASLRFDSMVFSFRGLVRRCPLKGCGAHRPAHTQAASAGAERGQKNLKKTSTAPPAGYPGPVTLLNRHAVPGCLIGYPATECSIQNPLAFLPEMKIRPPQRILAPPCGGDEIERRSLASASCVPSAPGSRHRRGYVPRCGRSLCEAASSGTAPDP